MSTFHELKCPKCGAAVKAYSNPFPTVDALIYEPDKGIVLIDREFEPFGWALPGGFVDYGETVEEAAMRGASFDKGANHTRFVPRRRWRKPSLTRRFTTSERVTPKWLAMSCSRDHSSNSDT